MGASSKPSISGRLVVGARWNFSSMLARPSCGHARQYGQSMPVAWGEVKPVTETGGLGRINHQA